MTTSELMLPEETTFDGTLTYAPDVPQLLRNHSAVECRIVEITTAADREPVRIVGEVFTQHPTRNERDANYFGDQPPSDC